MFTLFLCHFKEMKEQHVKMRRIEIVHQRGNEHLKVFHCMLNDRTFKYFPVLKDNGEYSHVVTRSKRCDNFWLVSSSIERTEAKSRLFRSKERLDSITRQIVIVP